MREIKPIKIAILSCNHGHAKGYYSLRNDPFYELVGCSVEPGYRPYANLHMLGDVPVYDSDEELYEKHPTKVFRANMGDQNHYTNQTKPGIYNRSYVGGITWQFGIFAITTEHNDYIYDTKLGTSVTMTLSVELLGNHLLLVCENDCYNSSLRIDRSYYQQYMN